MISETQNPVLTWNFSQVFGDKAGHGEIAEADIISAVEFNHDGEYLATGDKGGRVVLFERNQTSVGSDAEFRFFTEFQSHEPEFDYLKSLEIEEKINQIKWLPRRNAAHFLLTTNDKTIKLWKVSNKPIYVDATPPARDDRGVRVPLLRRHEYRTDARVKRVFANAHAYHINSISVNSDDETFISADDLRVNLWNLGVNDQSFNIVDIKPTTMEELTEVITAARFHPQQCNTFMYSSSKGAVKLCDMRAAALCDNHAKSFEEPLDPANKSFFSEIIASISDVQFSNNGRYFLSRDYLTIKVWDTHMETRPVQTFQVHDYLRPKLCDLYENDCIFDKFDACWSRDDNEILAGSYHNLFKVYDRSAEEGVCLEASRDNISGPTHTLKPVQIISGNTPRTVREQIHVEDIDYNLKILHAAWHPQRNILALAATNNLYLYHR
jgi:serine/threonine-protein phosphatase 2A regulatory subunit B